MTTLMRARCFFWLLTSAVGPGKAQQVEQTNVTFQNRRRVQS